MKTRFVPGATLAERYHIVEVKRGGMAEVAICRDTAETGAPLVAIKAIAPELLANSEARRRFDREAEAWMTAGRVPFGFVLPLDQVIVQGRTLLLKMPYCSKGSLHELLRAGPLPRAAAAEYATELLLGMHALNVELGLVHRDLKPSNILINDEGRLQISDLGLVRFTGDDFGRAMPRAGCEGETQFGQFLGTLLYAAPEQLLGVQPIDWRVDMWAFGIVVHEMFTGRRPFPDEDSASHLKTILSTKLVLRELAARSTRELATIVARCCAPNPNERYSTFGLLVADWDKAIKTSYSPAVGLLRRDGRIPLAQNSPADVAWTGVFYPERVPSDQGFLHWDVSVAAGISEARDYYRLDRYEDAIAAAEKTLGRLENPRSNINRLLAGQLTETHSFESAELADTERRMRRKMVPSRDMALEAMRWSMRALVALIESRPEENRWIAQLKRLADRVTAAALEDFEVLILAAEGYLCAGEHESAIRIGRSVLRAEPLNTLAGWVTFQAVLQSGNIDEARELATSLIDQYVLQDGPRHYGFAVRLAYGVKDVGTVIRLGPEALRREPGDLDVLGRLSVALLMSKRPEEAYRYFETMRRLAPDALMTRQLAASFETSG